MANPIIDIRGKKFASALIALVEPFDPTAATTIPEPERFASRARMLDGTSILSEQPPAVFARANGFRSLGKPDNIATNPVIAYRVEAFDLAKAQERNPDFKPEKSYASRLSWGKAGKGESVLLENDVDTVSAVVLRGQPDRGSRNGAGPAKRAPGVTG